MPQSPVDPAVREAIIAEEIAAGRVVRVSDVSNKTAEEQYRTGADTLIGVARGEKPIQEMAPATGAILEGNNKVLSSKLDRLPPPKDKEFRPQRKGIVSAARCLCYLKHHYSAATFNVECSVPQFTKVTDEAEFLLNTQEHLLSALATVTRHLVPRMGYLYPILSAAQGDIQSAVDKDKIPQHVVKDLITYLNERYDKAVQSRKGNAERDAEQVDKLEAVAEDRVRERLLGELLDNNVLDALYALGEKQPQQPAPEAPAKTPPPPPAPGGNRRDRGR